MKYKIKRLDFNVTYACNLSCKGCISLSDFDRRGVESYEDIKLQCEQWSQRLSPQVITLFGGEPLMHPRLLNVIRTIKEYWPKTTLRLITNGYLLKKYNPECWFEFKPFEIQVSIHRKDHEKLLTEQIKKIVSCRKDWKFHKISEEGHKDIMLSLPGFKIWKSKFKDFVIPFKLDNNKIKPYTSDPAKAHAICGAPNTPVLYKNKLFKCPPIANILDLDKDNLYNYKGLRHNEDLDDFVKHINKPESVCSMCPENRLNAINHFDKENVHVKNIN